MLKQEEIDKFLREKERIGYTMARQILNDLKDGGERKLLYFPDMESIREVFVKIEIEDGKRNYYLAKSKSFERISRTHLINFMSMGEVFL